MNEYKFMSMEEPDNRYRLGLKSGSNWDNVDGNSEIVILISYLNAPMTVTPSEFCVIFCMRKLE